MAFFVIEDADKVLDSGDDEWKAYLAEQGWDGSWGDSESADPPKVSKGMLSRTS